jgi:RNA polymerase sigma-70 factor (ECF subfamily)
MSQTYFSSEDNTLSRCKSFPGSSLDTDGHQIIVENVEPDIETLIYRAQNGEDNAFAFLYGKYFDQVFRYIFLRVRQAEQSEDLTQEVFLRAWHNIGSYQYQGKSLANWLFRIAHNLIIDYYRRSNKTRCIPVNEMLPADEDPVITVEERMGMSMVKQAIEGLPARQKEVISLRFIAELSVAETAQMTGITEGSVKKLQHEALLKLKRQLDRRGRDNPARISGLFLDYDGTISPLNVPRHQSRVTPQLEELLFAIRNTVPIGIVTTKDLPFILPRTPFARAWSAIAGLEIKTDSQLSISKQAKKTLPALNQALAYSKQNMGYGGVIEEKCDSTGQPLAFCVDWRQIKDQKAARIMSSRILAYCKQLPLKTIEYADKPYFDVFPCSINKGKALRTLKDTFNISGDILYMGDSVTDNLAFKEADISIGVTLGNKPKDLDCHYWINFDDVALFLSSLNKNNMTFRADLPGIRVKN